MDLKVGLKILLDECDEHFEKYKTCFGCPLLDQGRFCMLGSFYTRQYDYDFAVQKERQRRGMLFKKKELLK